MVGGEDPMIGAKVGRFVVKARLGKGGMGVVYRAHDPSLRRDVALKVLPDAHAQDAERRARFLREARAAAGLSDPHIAAIYEVGVDDARGVAFIAMELIDGHDLRQALRSGPLSAVDVERLALQIARALGKAHTAGIVHRDLKPENVMLSKDGDARVLDFGLAKHLEHDGDARPTESSDAVATRDGAVMGTPGYMAPEQVLAQPIDARADVFAFGAMMFELMTGRRPFQAATALAEALATTIEPVPPLVRPDVSRALTDAVVCCLQKDPAARPADGNALRALIDGSTSSSGTSRSMAASPSEREHSGVTPAGPMPSLEGVQPAGAVRGATDVPTGEAARPWARRPRVMAAAVMAALVVVAVGVGVARRPSPREQLHALLVNPDAKVACLPLATADGNPPELGVAAAAFTCAALGVERLAPQRFVGPAALLHMPLHGGPGFPERPFFTPEGAAVLAAAAETHAAFIDGDVGITDNGTRVTLRAHVGPAIAVEFGAAAPDFFTALIDAIAGLIEALELEPSLADPAEAQVIGDRPGALLRASARVEVAASQEHCQALAALSPLHAALRADACGHTARDANGLPTWPASPTTRLSTMSAPQRAAWTLRLNSALSPEQRRAAANAVRDARAPGSRLYTATMAEVELRAWLALGDEAAAHQAFDLAVEARPDACGPRVLGIELSDETTLRAATAWCPTAPHLWTTRSQLTKDTRAALAMGELAYLLSERAPDLTPALGKHLRILGEVERIRALASFHAARGRPGDARASTYLLALYEAETGRVQAALQRLTAWLLSDDSGEDAYELSLALRLEQLLGRKTLADRLLERELLSSAPPRPRFINDSSYFQLLGHASKPVAARALPVLREAIAAGVVRRAVYTERLLDAYARHLSGDAVGATEAARTLIGSGFVASALLSANRSLLVAHLKERLSYAQTPLSEDHAELARLLAEDGDVATATAMATQLIEKLERADVDVPAVAAMRALRRELERR